MLCMVMFTNVNPLLVKKKTNANKAKLNEIRGVIKQNQSEVD